MTAIEQALKTVMTATEDWLEREAELEGRYYWLRDCAAAVIAEWATREDGGCQQLVQDELRKAVLS